LSPARHIRHGAGLGLLSLLSAACQADVSIYGRLNVALESVGSSVSGVHRTILRESNQRSVLGFTGGENLGEGYRALFQIEGALALDTGSGGSFANRDTRVGMGAPWGTLFLGHWTTPYLQATSGFDPFYPTTAGYMALMGNGSASSTNHVIDRVSLDRRQQNIMQYATPPGTAFAVRLAYAVNDGDRGPGGSHPDLWSAALSWEDGPVGLVWAHEAHRDYQGPGLSDTGNKLGISWQWADWRVAMAVERLHYATPTGSLQRQSAYLSAVWKLGAGSFRLGLTHAGDGVGPAGIRLGGIVAGPRTGARHWTFGYDYSLSNRTTVSFYGSRIRNDADAVYDFAINSWGVRPGESPTLLSVGLRHSF